MASLGNLFITLVVIVAAISSVNGQSLDLRAIRLGTSTAYTAYYLTGQSTSQIGQLYLPSCLAQGATGSLIQLTNTNTGVVVGEHNQPFDQSGSATSTIVEWDTVKHPTLDGSYTGLYKCISDVPGAMTAQQTFRLHVVVLPGISLFNHPTNLVGDTKYQVACKGHGYPMPTVKLFANDVELPRFGTDLKICTGGVCGVTHWALLNGVSYTANTMANIKCSVDINQPSFTCSAANKASLQTACFTASKTAEQSSTRQVSTTCLQLGTYRGYQYNGAYSSDIGTMLDVSCRTGYTSRDSINSITCQTNGAWTPLPVCSGGAGYVTVHLDAEGHGFRLKTYTVYYLN
eukprot:scpid80899/ scgid5282/ 